jgi:CHAD domain-containing protein
VQNRLQDGSWPMNPGKNSNSRTTSHPHASANQPEKVKKLTLWKRLLVRCGRKPTRKRVHDLRTVTLRIQAELEYRLQGEWMDEEVRRIAQRWCTQAEKLRGALAQVREADVWVAMLANLHEAVERPGGYSPRSNRGCVSQIEQLEEKIKQKRGSWEKMLIGKIEDRRKRLDKLSDELEQEVSLQQLEAEGAGTIIDKLAKVAVEFPLLNADNLHEFRKSIKSVRYLAEIFGTNSPQAKKQAAMLKKMQTAVGTWHDWEALARRAQNAGGSKQSYADLAELLETLTAESLDKAIDVCERTTQRLLEQGIRNADSATDSLQKLPVRAVVPSLSADPKKLA